MDPGGHPVQDPVFAVKRHPAGGLPGQSCPLARRLLCLQPLPVLWLLPGGPALHPALPAAAAAYPSAPTAQWICSCALDGGRPSTPEARWHPMNWSWFQEDFIKEKPFLPQGFSSVFIYDFVFPFLFCSLETKFIVSKVPLWLWKYHTQPF